MRVFLNFSISFDVRAPTLIRLKIATNMHELFTTAVVQDVLVEETLKILQGLCAMTPVRQLQWRLIFEGPKAPPLVGIQGPQMQSRKQANIPLWKELSEQLVRQSYYMAVSYEVNEDHFGIVQANRGEDSIQKTSLVHMFSCGISC